MTADEIRAKSEQLRIKLGYTLAIGGLVVSAGLVLVLVLWKGLSATDTVAVVGAFTGVFGTVIGAFFGVQVGAADKEKAQADKDNAEKKLQAEAQRLQVALSQMEPGVAQGVFDKWAKMNLVS